MDRPDARLFELGQGGVQARARVGRTVVALPLALDRGAQAELQLAGRRFREGDGDDAVEVRVPGHERRHDATDELGRLARPGRGFDHERRVELAADAVALRLIGEGGIHHGIARRRVSWARRSVGFLLARTSSCGPHTGR
jgi:hypothetical protein